jgi:ribosomal protein S9
MKQGDFAGSTRVVTEPDYSVVAVVVVGGGLVGAVEAVEDALMRTRKTQAMVLLP